MRKTTIILCVAMAVAAALAADVFARGFGGFHGGGGFGGFHGGGFSAGGFHAGGFSAGGFDRGGFSGGGFDRGGFGGGGFDRSSFGGYGGDRFGGGDSGFRAGGFSGYGGSVSRGQLSSFLNLPTDGGFHAAGGAFGASGAAASSYGAAAGRAGAMGHEWTGPNGTEVADGTVGAQGIAAGPGGFAAGGAVAHGTAIKGPNGNVYTHGAAAGRGIAAGPNGVAAGRGFATGASATGAWGHYSATYMHAQGVAGNRWFAGSGVFTPHWCDTHPWAWHPAAYAGVAWGVAAWRWATWPAIGAWIGYDAAPGYYDYGDNITLQNGDVYYGDQLIATQQQYYQEAANLAGQGDATDNSGDGDWLPLGIFGLMGQGQQQSPDMIFQLAVNKQGIIKGNYYDQVADNTAPVHGSVNKKNQRVAWQVGANKNLVVETGLDNLTLKESTALVHYGPDDTVQYTMVRMKQPDSDGQSSAGQQSAPQ